MIDERTLENRKRIQRNWRKQGLARVELRQALKANYLAKLKYLWLLTPSDCRSALILEFLFEPQAFKVRYDEEVYFQYKVKHRNWE